MRHVITCLCALHCQRMDSASQSERGPFRYLVQVTHSRTKALEVDVGISLINSSTNMSSPGGMDAGLMPSCLLLVEEETET